MTPPLSTHVVFAIRRFASARSALRGLFILAFLWLAAGVSYASLRDGKPGPVRVLFLGHDREHHDSNRYYPMLAKAFGREGIYFDYVTSVEEALGDADYLARFDALLLYANHDRIEPHQWENLRSFVEGGGGFVAVHSASACFVNEPAYADLIGGRFAHHKSGVFAPRISLENHPAMRGLEAFEAWDETYVHENHNPDRREVLMRRHPDLDPDNIEKPEPWTWTRTEGKGRIFYTASGHDERTWSLPEFQALLKNGILWAIGDDARANHVQFLESRPALTYEDRDHIPNYQVRPKPLLYQHPLSAEASMQYTQVPIGFRLELFAAEPDIINPISLAWDERGRLWVAETVDYPNEVRSQGGEDRIKILEDTDGDGRCDKVTVFADGLNIPASLTHWDGGVIVAQAPHFLYLKDTDGDDRADERTVLLSGWGVNDTHAGPSNLRYGFDNWIWGAVGYARFKGEVGGQNLNFGSGIFRLRPDASALEFLHQFNNNTWGLGFTGGGDVFGSTANNNPSFFCNLRATSYSEGRAGPSARMVADRREIHPITPNIRQVDAVGAYTAGCGHAFATSPAFPKSWRDRSAFICAPTGNLLGRFQIEEDGAGFRALNRFALVASADEWFSPVAAEVGPDGHLWLADWYNFIIQHNPAPTVDRGGYKAERGIGNAHVNPNRDRQHGRIYRVVWDSAPKPTIRSLADADVEALVAALDDQNLFWRLTAQRLLVERQESIAARAAPLLRARVKEPGPGAVHALWTLHGLAELDRETHQHALLAGDRPLKQQAVLALGSDADATRLFFDTAVVTDRDPHVRRTAFEKLATLPPNETVSQAIQGLARERSNREDTWLNLALKASGTVHGEIRYALGENLVPNPSFEEHSDGQPAGWRPRGYSGDARHALVTDPKLARTGESALSIHSDDGADTSWFTKLTLEPDTEYRVSAWIRTDKLRGAKGAMMNIHEIQLTGRTNALQRKNDWTEVEGFFNSGNQTDVTLNCLFGGWGQSTGTAWYDDVAVQEVKAIDTPKDALTGGDAERGKALFHQHPVAACVRCHVIEGQGGPVGPALDGIASRKSRDYLSESLSDPQAQLAEGFQQAVSPMPPMKVLLTPQEFADILAYLMTLK